jgi:hypothetical protein
MFVVFVFAPARCSTPTLEYLNLLVCLNDTHIRTCTHTRTQGGRIQRPARRHAAAHAGLEEGPAGARGQGEAAVSKAGR